MQVQKAGKSKKLPSKQITTPHPVSKNKKDNSLVDFENENQSIQSKIKILEKQLKGHETLKPNNVTSESIKRKETMKAQALIPRLD